jgi:hypothetical protein
MRGVGLLAALSLSRPRNYSKEVPVWRSATLGTTELADHAAMIDQAKFRLTAFSRPAATFARDNCITELRIATERHIGHLGTPIWSLETPYSLSLT